MGREEEGRFKREGTWVFLQLTHVDWQRPTEYCKAIILQLKMNDKKERRIGNLLLHTTWHTAF